jgi:hypothetical protein
MRRLYLLIVFTIGIYYSNIYSQLADVTADETIKGTWTFKKTPIIANPEWNDQLYIGKGVIGKIVNIHFFDGNDPRAYIGYNQNDDEFKLVNRFDWSEFIIGKGNNGLTWRDNIIWNEGNSNTKDYNWTVKNLIAYNQTDNSVTASNTAKFNAYGMLGNRGSLYITNSGDIRFGIGSVHGANNVMYMNNTGLSIKTGTTATEALDVNGNTRINGELKIIDDNTKLLEGWSNTIRVKTNYGQLEMGPGNSDWCHFKTDRSKFWFEKNVYINGDLSRYGDNDFLIQRNGSTKLTIGNGTTTHSQNVIINGSGNALTVNGNIVAQGNITSQGKITATEIKVEDIAATNLNLNGNLAANNITVKANGQTADFVFADNYNLKSLSEVEAFIKEHKHLEDIPSAVEMEEQGVNLAEMNKLLLQKMEELTLYAIQQKAEKEKLEERLERLEKLLLIEE